jgi:hypothetical protein
MSLDSGRKAHFATAIALSAGVMMAAIGLLHLLEGIAALVVTLVALDIIVMWALITAPRARDEASRGQIRLPLRD